MYTLSERDINRLIILTAEKTVVSEGDSKKEYQHLLNKLKTYKEQNFVNDTHRGSNLK